MVLCWPEELYVGLMDHLPAGIDLERPGRTLCWHNKTLRLFESLSAYMESLRNVDQGLPSADLQSQESPLWARGSL